MSHLSTNYPTIYTLRAAKKFLEDFAKTDRAHVCCHGHVDCSTYRHGPCMDETLGNFPEAEDAS